MPFANINFSELIKAAISLFLPASLPLVSILFLLKFTTSDVRYRRRRHDHDDDGDDGDDGQRRRTSSPRSEIIHGAAECMRLYFTSHPVHVGRHIAGVLRGPESEIGVLVVTVALVVFGRHRHQDFVVLRNVCYNPAVAAADRGTRALSLIISVSLPLSFSRSLARSLASSDSSPRTRLSVSFSVSLVT